MAAASITESQIVGYSDIISAINTACQAIGLSSVFKDCDSDEDGRCISSFKEGEVLHTLGDYFASNYPTISYEIQPKPRWWWDMRIGGIPFNLKLTSCSSADNAFNKTALYYSIIGKEPSKGIRSYNDFWKLLKATTFKTERVKQTEYHYLSVNKNTGDFLVRSLFDVEHIRGNPSNDLQIHWGKEFTIKDDEVKQLSHRERTEIIIRLLQVALQKRIASIKEFAYGNTDDLFKLAE